MAEPNLLSDLTSIWGYEAEMAVCPHCDWNFVIAKGVLPQRCPHCFRENLTPNQQAEVPHQGPPEMVLPFQLPVDAINQGIAQFARAVRFAPQDLTAQQLTARLKRVYIPAWLVDVDVNANWQAESGFNYQVVSHQDRFDERGGGWTSHQVNEGRIRWEPRAGRLTRHYSNIAAPAIEEERQLCQNPGTFDLRQAQMYRPEDSKGSFVRLPNRSVEDAWRDADPAVQSAASEECREAAGADHLREFRWSPQYTNHNWTLFLRPVYSTYYLDDEGKPQPVYIHGQSGKASGVRRASMKRAQRAALIILGVAVLVFILSLILTAAGVVAPVVLAAGGIGMAISVFIGLGALIPLAIAWQFNRSQIQG